MDEFTRKSTQHMDQKLVKQAIKAIDKSPELKKIRSIKDGMSYSEINSGVNDQQYKDNYDKITWNKDKPKPKFKVRVNGKVVNDEEE
jgi:hypothetical protein